MNPLLFFWIFLKASLLSFSGLGNLPFLHQDLLDLGWATETDFLSAIAVGQVSPGPTGLWSISLGYLTYGWAGAFLALLALSIPPLLAIGVISFYRRIENLLAVQNFTRGLMLGVVGLTLGTAWALARTAIVDWRDLVITCAAMGLALTQRVPAILILMLAAAAGCLIHYAG